MKKSYLVLSGVIAIAAVFALYNSPTVQQSYTPRSSDPVATEASGAEAYYNLLRANPETGVIDKEIEMKVLKAMMKLPNNPEARNTEFEWTSHGPDNIGGRTRALHVYKEDPNKILAGGVSGGLFRSLDGGATWNRLQGFNDNSAIASVTRLGNGTIYVGTGNSFLPGTGSISYSGARGHGLFKSTDDGQTFTAVFTPDGIDFSSGPWSKVNEVVASPIDNNVVWIAYGGGLAKLNDATGDFSDKISTQVIDFDMSNDGQGIICVNGGTIKVSMDGGETFNSISNNESLGGIPTSNGRKVVAISPDDKNYLYVTTTSGGSLKGVFASMNGGAYFDRIAEATVFDSNGLPSNPFFFPFGSNAQGWYDNALTVVPGSPGSIILGGIEMYRLNVSPNSTETSINGTWYQINNQFGFPGPDYVHADIHQFEWDSNGIFYVGCDGGVFRSIDTEANTFYPINYNYVTSQVYGIGYNEHGNIFAGMQDNGSMVIAGAGGNTSREGIRIGGGDGFDIEPSNYELMAFICSQYNNISKLTYNFNGGGNVSPMALKEGTSGEGNAPFYSCFRFYENFDETNAPNSIEFVVQEDISAGTEINYQSATFSHTLTAIADQDYFADQDTIYLQDRVQTLFAYAGFGQFYLTRNAVNNHLDATVDWAQYSVNGTPLCFEYSPDGNQLYIGTSTGRIYRLNNLRSAFDKTALQALELAQIYSGGTVITDLAIYPWDANKLVASIGSYSSTNHVIYTGNATTAEGNSDFENIWNIPGDLANMPVYSVTFDRASDDLTIIAGTEYGIFTTADRGNTPWVESNTGDMYRVPVFDLKQQTKVGSFNQNVIYAGTHGAGVFSTSTQVVGIEDIEDDASKGSIDLTIYPNPATEVAQFNLVIENAADITTYVYDINGKIVRTKASGRLPEGSNLISLDVNDFSNGTYFVAVTIDGKKSRSAKFVVNK